MQNGFTLAMIYLFQLSTYYSSWDLPISFFKFVFLVIFSNLYRNSRVCWESCKVDGNKQNSLKKKLKTLLMNNIIFMRSINVSYFIKMYVAVYSFFFILFLC